MKRLPLDLQVELSQDLYWSSPGRFEYVVFVAAQRIGHIRVQQSGDLWIVEGVAVNRVERQGIGTLLYETALQEAKKRGGRLASICRATVYARAFWSKQLAAKRAEILAPARWGSDEETALVSIKPDVHHLS